MISASPSGSRAGRGGIGRGGIGRAGSAAGSGRAVGDGRPGRRRARLLRRGRGPGTGRGGDRIRLRRGRGRRGPALRRGLGGRALRPAISASCVLTTAVRSRTMPLSSPNSTVNSSIWPSKAASATSGRGWRGGGGGLDLEQAPGQQVDLAGQLLAARLQGRDTARGRGRPLRRRRRRASGRSRAAGTRRAARTRRAREGRPSTAPRTGRGPGPSSDHPTGHAPVAEGHPGRSPAGRKPIRRIIGRPRPARQVCKAMRRRRAREFPSV